MNAFPNLARQFNNDFRDLEAELKALSEIAASRSTTTTAAPPLDQQTLTDLAECERQLGDASSRRTALRKDLEAWRNSGPEDPDSRLRELQIKVARLKDELEQQERLQRAEEKKKRELDAQLLDLQMKGF